MTPASDEKSSLELQLARALTFVSEGARYIDDQIRNIKAKIARKESTVDDDHSLDVMIKLQAAHVAHRDLLKKQLQQLNEPGVGPRDGGNGQKKS